MKSIPHLIIVALIVVVACNNRQPSNNIIRSILDDSLSIYHTSFAEYNQIDLKSLPIGVFDSGTGGLALLEVLLKMDEFNNSTGELGADSIPDFESESFEYFGDQANMPYGNYSAEGQVDILKEHIIKDARFLMGGKYTAGSDPRRQLAKLPSKMIVVACNTATAYGLDEIRSYVNSSNTGIGVVGVIDAGAIGALTTFKKDENGSIGVLATAGTVTSNGYVRKIEQLKDALGYSGDIRIYQQAGVGIAEALDEESNYYDKALKSVRSNYRGPSILSESYPIDTSLMDVYNFSQHDNALLCESTLECGSFQLNSAANYVRYHLVSLLETIRRSVNPQPLKTLVLGCTHYPYVADTIKSMLDELYNYQKNDTYYYREILSEHVDLVDPALNTAKEVYQHLHKSNLLNKKTENRKLEFFISIPNPFNRATKTDSSGNFTYEYKYGRTVGSQEDFTLIVPFSRNNISEDVYSRLRLQTPTLSKYLDFQVK